MDILSLLIILIAVVVITWIVASYMEIEKLKKMVGKQINGKQIIRQIGDDNIQPEQWKEEETKQEGHYGILGTYINHPQPIEFKDGIDRRIIKNLDKNKIYYLCHPCTSGKRSIEENKYREEYLYRRIINLNPGINILRPLTVIPEGMDHKEAMERCFKMMDACHGIILPLGWQISNGCKQEHDRAHGIDLERIFLSSN